MKNSRNILLNALAAAMLMVLTGVAFYFVGRKSGERILNERIAELEDSIENLNRVQEDAIITKRVSQQMEDIAYVQKNIAEDQLKVAQDQEKKAKAQELIAKEQEKKANVAKAEADRQKRYAEAEKDSADAQALLAKEQAARAKAQETLANDRLEQAQTMSHRLIGSSLGTTAFTQTGTSDSEKEISSLLSWWSWEFLRRYDGNKYNSDTFQALAQNSNTDNTFHLGTHSCVNATCMIPGAGSRCVAVTDYGEVALCDPDRMVVLRDSSKAPHYNFHGVVARADHALAMTSEGQIVRIDYNGSTKADPVKRDRCTSMVELPGGRLALAGTKGIDIVDENTLQTLKTIDTGSTPSCIYNKDGILGVYMLNGEYAEMDSNGNFSRMPAPKEHAGIVTAAFYDTQTGLTMLGREDGITEIFNHNMLKMTEIPGMASSITSIVVQDTISVICSYDHTVQVCNMPKFKMESGYTFKEELPWTEPKTGGDAPNTWVNPVRIRLLADQDGWPLCIAGDPETMDVYIGTSRGHIKKYNISVDMMAAKVKSGLKQKGCPQLSPSDWNRFMGDDRIIRYETIDYGGK